MKKTLGILAVITLLILSACGKSASLPDQTPHGNYTISEPIYYPYKNAGEMIEATNTIFIGKITGISFQVLDGATSLPPTKEAEPNNLNLYTIYDIDVAASYKGSAADKTQLRVYGGLMNYREEEQLKLMKAHGLASTGIPIVQGKPAMTIGETYLFMARQYETGLPTLMNFDQGVFNLHNPFEKHTNDLTACGIISALGQEKWDDFWAQWQKDNPKWQTWLNEDEVAKVLNKG